MLGFVLGPLSLQQPTETSSEVAFLSTSTDRICPDHLPSLGTGRIVNSQLYM